jgi:hypothetical protein
LAEARRQRRETKQTFQAIAPTDLHRVVSYRPIIRIVNEPGTGAP